MNQGIVLANQNVRTAVDGEGNVNDTELGRPGYGALSKLVPSGATSDAAILSITFKCPSNKRRVSFKYVFASNEYHGDEWEPNDSDFEDVMVAFLNGVNVATVNGKYVSVNTMYGSSNYIDNMSSNRRVEINGLSKVLQTKKTTVVGNKWNVLKIAVADGAQYADQRVGTFLFIEKDSLKCVA